MLIRSSIRGTPTSASVKHLRARVMLSTAVVIVSMNIVNPSGISVTRITQEDEVSPSSRAADLMMGFHSMDSVIEAEESQPSIITIDKHGQVSQVSVAEPGNPTHSNSHGRPEPEPRRIFKKRRKGNAQTILLLPGAEPEPKYQVHKYNHYDPYHHHDYHDYHPYHEGKYHEHYGHHHHSYSPYSASVVHHTHSGGHRPHHGPSVEHPMPPTPQGSQHTSSPVSSSFDESCYVNVCKSSGLKTIQKAVKKGVDQSLNRSLKEILDPFLTDLSDLLSRELPPGMANRFKDDVRELADRVYGKQDRDNYSDDY